MFLIITVVYLAVNISPGYSNNAAETNFVNGMLGLTDPAAILLGPVTALTYNAERDNEYCLYTKQNPNVCQRLVYNNESTIHTSNFDPNNGTIFLIHGWQSNVFPNFEIELVKALLAVKENYNIIAVNWGRGSNDVIYVVACNNVLSAGKAIANFITFLYKVIGPLKPTLHVLAHSLGCHVAGVACRTAGTCNMITACDPAKFLWEKNDNRLKADDSEQTQVIHTSKLGMQESIGQIDFTPNGGSGMPGCGITDIVCDHARSYKYFAESVGTGGFAAKGCMDYKEAQAEKCTRNCTSNMGGLDFKTGCKGVFSLETNAESPYSKS